MNNHQTTKKTPRQKARSFALQALYQWLLNPSELVQADEFTRGLRGFNKADIPHYEKVLTGAATNKEALLPAIAQAADRKLEELSPIELAILLLGSFELNNCAEIPYKVIINEYVEVAKEFGATDGFRYVNGVLHKLALTARALEYNDDN